MANGIVEYLKNVGRGHDPAWRRELLEDASSEELPASLREDMYEAAMPPPPSAAQALWGTGLITGVGGIAEAGGVYPEPPAHGTSIYEMLTGPRTPSVKEHWQTGHPWIAGLQTLGAVVPTAAYAKAASGPIRRGIASLRGADDLPEGVAAQLADLPDDASRREFLKNMGLTAAGIAALGVGIGRGVRPASTAARVASRALPSSRPNIAGFHKLFAGAEAWPFGANPVSQWDRLRALRHIESADPHLTSGLHIRQPQRLRSVWASRNIDEGVDWAGMSERYGLGPDDFHILAVNPEIAVPSIPSNISVYGPEFNTPIYENLFGAPSSRGGTGIGGATVETMPSHALTPVPDLVRSSHIDDLTRVDELSGKAQFPRILNEGKVAIDEVMGVPVLRAGRRGNTGPSGGDRGGNHQLMIPTEQGLRKLELHRLKQGVGDRLAPETLQRLEGPAGYNTTARDMGEPLGTLRSSPDQVRRQLLPGRTEMSSILPLEVTRPSDRVGFTGVGPARSLPTGPTTSGLNPESLREVDALREFYGLPLAKKGGGGITASRRIQRFQNGGGVDLAERRQYPSGIARVASQLNQPTEPNPIPGQVAQGLASGLLGAPVDLTSMVMRPFGYSVPPEKTVGSTEWLGTKMGADPTTTPFVAGSFGPFPDATDAMRLAARVDPQALAGIMSVAGAGITKGGDDTENLLRRLADMKRRFDKKPPISRKQEVLETELDQNQQRQKDLNALMEDSTAAWTRPMREELSTLVNRQGQLDQELRGFREFGVNFGETVKDRYGNDVQRYWFHNLRGRPPAPGGGISAYDPTGVGNEYKNAVMLSPVPYGAADENTLIDISKLQGDRSATEFFTINPKPGTIATTGQAEGYRVYGGDIPESAIVPKVQKRDGGAIMSSMTRGITGLSRPAGRGPLDVPRGTLQMQGGGAVDQPPGMGMGPQPGMGPQQGGGMFLQPGGGGGIPAFNASDYFMPAGPAPAPVAPPPSNFSPFGSVYTPQATAATSPLSFVPATPVPTASTGATAPTVGEPTVRTDTPGVIKVTPNPTNNYGGYTYDSPQPKLEDFIGVGVDPEVGEAAYDQAYGDWLSATTYGGPTAPDQENEPSPSRSDRMEESTEREMRERLYDPASVLTPDELRLKESGEFLPGYTGFGPDGFGTSYVAPPTSTVAPPTSTVAPPTSTVAPPTSTVAQTYPQPRRGDYDSGTEYNDALKDWKASQAAAPQVAPPPTLSEIIQPTVAPSPPYVPPPSTVAPQMQPPMPPYVPPPQMPPYVPPPQMQPPPQAVAPPAARVGPKPRRGDYDSGREYRMDLEDWKASGGGYAQGGGVQHFQEGMGVVRRRFPTSLEEQRRAESLSPELLEQWQSVEDDPYTLSLLMNTQQAQTPEAGSEREALEEYQLNILNDPDAYNAFMRTSPAEGGLSDLITGGEEADKPLLDRTLWGVPPGYHQYRDGEEPSKPPLQGLLEESGLTAKDLTDLVFDPSNPVDYAILGIAAVVPPAGIVAKLGQRGLQGKNLYRIANKIYEYQQKMPRWAGGGNWERVRRPIIDPMNPYLPVAPGGLPITKPSWLETAARTYYQEKLVDESREGITSLHDFLRPPAEDFVEHLPEEGFEERTQ
jgi:hypothetical protein